ncbi:MAG: EF-P lysine aminoacylase GenX [Candidatus Thiodiazotropha sp. (ex Epidulcina cf. delphinae)]|nr:EF-P lysine aminoacylase GenX [Candidatus Thiodiazotropha sp. (ex Epidulcina cf. delphinae)]
MFQPDAWRPSAPLGMIRARAAMLSRIREFFQQAGVLEVESPICSRYGATDPAIDSLKARYTGPGAAQGLDLYLQTSPEFPMKRLLAAGSGPIYQLCKAFRDGELGRRHNPEFSLLEWYRPGFDHHRLMDEAADLINRLVETPLAVEKLTYGEAFEQTLALDPHTASRERLRGCAIEQGVPSAEDLTIDRRDGWLDLLLSHRIEPRLGNRGMTFLYDYPAGQAALARVRAGTPAVAERFELYLSGMEIANGFHELTDGREQRRRFDDDNRRRRQSGQRVMPMDEPLLAALTAGMPACAGVALGIDRLLMFLTGCSDIRQVLAFDFSRA